MNTRRVTIVTAIIFLLFLFYTFFISGNSDGYVYIEPSDTIADSDNDGVPNWLEHLTDADASNPQSFPYERDLALAQTVSIDDVLYGGPDEFTRDLVRRYAEDPNAEFTTGETEHLVRATEEYFQEQAQLKSLPDVNVSINPNVDGKVFVDNFILGLQTFLNTRVDLETLTLGVLQENNDAFALARTKRAECSSALKIFPEEIPAAIFEPYYNIIERITYLCHALDEAFRDRSAITHFYVIRLISEGEIVQQSLNGGDITALLEEEISQIITFFDVEG